MKNLGILSFVAILLFSLVGCAERKVVVENRVVVSIAPLKPLVFAVVTPAVIVKGYLVVVPFTVS